MGFRLQILLSQSEHTTGSPEYQNLNSIWAPTHPIAFSRAALLKIAYQSSNNKLLYFEVYLVWGPSYSDWIDCSLFVHCWILVEMGAGVEMLIGSLYRSPVVRVSLIYWSPCDAWRQDPRVTRDTWQVSCDPRQPSSPVTEPWSPGSRSRATSSAPFSENSRHLIIRVFQFFNVTNYLG